MGQVTIQQVARTAGVSPSTVSNLLNGRTNRMSAQTLTRINAAIAELGYRPNKAAQQLRTGKTRTIGLIVPSVGNPFWGAFARRIEAAAAERDYNVLLCNSERDPGREQGYAEELWEDGVRGLVLCSSLPSLDHLTPVIDRGMQLVTFDRPAQPNDPESIVSISIDNRVGAYLATQHLIDLGHTDLAFISGSLASLNRAGRYRGFQDALTAAGLDVPEPDSPAVQEFDTFGDVEAAQLGRQAIGEVLASGRAPTGIVAINDMTALGVCRGVRDAGLRVGTDVSVAGFDDIVLAELYDPPLTTVRQPIAEMARMAVGILAPGSAETSGGRSVLMRPELVVRESTTTPPAR